MERFNQAKSRKVTFREVMTLLAENILTIVTIGLAVKLYIQSQPSAPPVDDSLVLIFSLLATLTISDFITRLKYLTRIRRDLDLIANKKLNDSPFVKVIPFKEELEAASNVLIATNTGHKTIGGNDEACEAFLAKGGSLKLILMSPLDPSKALEMAARRGPKNFGIEYYRNRVINTLKDIHKAWIHSGSLSNLAVKTCDFAPSFGLYIFEPESNNGRMYIRIFAHLDSLNRSTNLFIRKSEHPELFANYLRQFKLMEEASLEFDLKSMHLLSTF